MGMFRSLFRRQAAPESQSAFPSTSTEQLRAEEAPETRAFRAASTVRALERIASREIEIRGVIDIGASNGMWTAEALPIFSDARYLLIEAQRGHVDALKRFTGEHSNTEYVLAAAGDEEGEVFFDDSNLFGGLASKERTDLAKTSVPMITVDRELERRSFKGPYMLKLDTHGFEVPILRGATRTLKQCELVVIETYNFRIAPGSLLFHEMCSYMAELGFGVIDISEPLWRAHDRAFWQMDLFFVKLSRSEFRHLKYS